MKKNKWKILSGIGFIGVALILYITVFNSTAYSTIDMTGNHTGETGMWEVSLNTQVGYDNELVATLVTEEFEPPSEVFVEILVEGQNIYETNLKKEEDDFSDSGVYKGMFDAIEVLEKNYEEVTVTVSFDDETVTIPLTSIETME